MRKSTLLVTSLVSLSAVTLAWNQGQQSGDDLLLPAIDTSVDAQPTQVAPSETQPTATEPGQTATAEPIPQDTSATSEPTATTKPTATATATPAPAAPQVVTKTSDPIDYKYGTVQIAMTKTDGTITSIEMVQGDATNGRAEAYVTLINATIQVQGINYGNISGATFTVDAFKKAVDNVLKKF